MENKIEKAKAVHAIIAELNKAIREARKAGLTVEIKPAYKPEKLDDAVTCQIGEYVPYS